MLIGGIPCQLRGRPRTLIHLLEQSNLCLAWVLKRGELEVHGTPLERELPSLEVAWGLDH